MRYQVEYLRTVACVASRRACAAASTDIVMGVSPTPFKRVDGAHLSNAIPHYTDNLSLQPLAANGLLICWRWLANDGDAFGG
jgi:hypothetical protein